MLHPDSQPLLTYASAAQGRSVAGEGRRRGAAAQGRRRGGSVGAQGRGSAGVRRCLRALCLDDRHEGSRGTTKSAALLHHCPGTGAVPSSTTAQGDCQ